TQSSIRPSSTEADIRKIRRNFRRGRGKSAQGRNGVRTGEVRRLPRAAGFAWFRKAMPLLLVIVITIWAGPTIAQRVETTSPKPIDDTDPVAPAQSLAPFGPSSTPSFNRQPVIAVTQPPVTPSPVPPTQPLTQPYSPLQPSTPRSDPRTSESQIVP